MKLDITDLGGRIAIIGGSNSGKSTLANKLSQRLELPIYHLDRYRFQPGSHYVPLPKVEFLAKVADMAAEDKWIIEGAYANAIPLQLERATSVIHLEPSRWIALYRYLRLCRRVKTKKEQRIGVEEDAVTKFGWGMVNWILRDYPKDDKKVRQLLKLYTGKQIKAARLTL